MFGVPQHSISLWEQVHGERPPIPGQCFTEARLLPQVQVNSDDATHQLLRIKMILCCIPHLATREDGYLRENLSNSQLNNIIII